MNRKPSDNISTNEQARYTVGAEGESIPLHEETTINSAASVHNSWWMDDAQRSEWAEALAKEVVAWFTISELLEDLVTKAVEGVKEVGLAPGDQCYNSGPGGGSEPVSPASQWYSWWMSMQDNKYYDGYYSTWGSSRWTRHSLARLEAEVEAERLGRDRAKQQALAEAEVEVRAEELVKRVLEFAKASIEGSSNLGREDGGDGSTGDTSGVAGSSVSGGVATHDVPPFSFAAGAQQGGYASPGTDGDGEGEKNADRSTLESVTSEVVGVPFPSSGDSCYYRRPSSSSSRWMDGVPHYSDDNPSPSAASVTAGSVVVPSWSYLNCLGVALEIKSGTKASSLSRVEGVVRTLAMTLTFTATLLVLCPGLPEMVFGATLPVLAPVLQIFAQCVFPLIAALEVWNAISALVHFSKAPNKNLERTAELVLALSAAGIAISAVALFLSGASPILVTGLLLGNVGLSTLYHTVQFFHHAYHFLSESSEQPELRNFFLDKAVDHLSSVATGLALATGLVFCFLLPALGIALPPFIVAVTVLTVAAVLLSNLVYRCYRKTHPLNYPQAALEISRAEHEEVASAAAEHREVKVSLPTTPTARTGYYATRGYFPNLVEVALVARNAPSSDGCTGELTAGIQSGEYLFRECEQKIEALLPRVPSELEIEGQPLETQIISSETQLDKARYLIRNAIPLLPTDDARENFDPNKALLWAAVVDGTCVVPLHTKTRVELAREMLFSKANHDFSPPVSGAFQSFFKNKSATQELSETLEVHHQALKRQQGLQSHPGRCQS